MSGGFVFGIPGAPNQSHGSKGVFGFVGNLVEDAAEMVRGLPMGLVNTVEHPIRTGELMAKGIWQDWSPLFEGHVGEWAHNVYDHPLAPLLDVATVFTGGAALGARMGARLAATGAISSDSALARLGSMPKTMILDDPNAAARLAKGKSIGISRTKLLPVNPIYNKAYRVAMSLADANPAIPNWFSSSKVYHRLDRMDWANSGLAYRAGMAAAMKAGETLVKAGHNTMPLLEEQLHHRAYMNLWQNSPAIPAQVIVDKYGGKLPTGFSAIRPDVRAGETTFQVFDKPATDLDTLAGHLQALGKHLTRPPEEWRQAVYKDPQTGEAMVRLAHKRNMEATFTDGARSAHFLAKLYRYPTAIWKYAMVGLSPRTVVDNAVGNWWMYAMRQGGAHAIHGFVEAVRYTRGLSKAEQIIRETGLMPISETGPKYLRHFQGEIGNTFGSAIGGGTGLGAHVGEDTAGSGLSKMYKHSVYPLVHKYADVPVRVAAIAAYLRGDASVQALMEKGYTFDKAADAMLNNNPELRDRTIAHARTVAGNYQTLSKSEQIMRDFVPFYLWDKHIVMHVGNMLRDRPGTVLLAGMIGKQGSDTTRQKIGDIPTWMLGSIPLPLRIPGENGRQTLLSTTGLNPYSSVADLASAAQALSVGHTLEPPGDSLLSTVNPVIKGLIQQTMGSSAVGAPVQSHGGILPSMLVDVFNSMRPVQIARTAAGYGVPDRSKTGKPRLFKTDINTLLSSLLGVPIQEVDLARAHALQQQIENGGKKKKKGRGFSFIP